MVPISLHHMTVLDTTLVELVDIAASQACNHVCLFVSVPKEFAGQFPVCESLSQAQALRQRLDDAGISVWNLEAFFIRQDIPPETYRAACEIGAILGARSLTALNYEPDGNAAAESLARLCDLAAEYRLTVGLEWIKPSSTRTLREAVSLVHKCGAQNATLTVDPLHLMRNGGVPRDLQSLDAKLIGYVQICDGPATVPEEEEWSEMTSNRLVPGEGALPLHDFLQSLPSVPVLSVEVPRKSLLGVSAPGQRASIAIAATRRLLKEAAIVGRG